VSKFTSAEKSLIKTMGLTIGIVILFSNLDYIYAQQTAVNPYFSVQVPNGWVYRDNHPFLYNNSIVFTPNEFTELLISNMSRLINNGVVVEIAPDPNFPIKNAPLETYVNHSVTFAEKLSPKYENATIGGERAIKVFINGTELAIAHGMPNVTSMISLDYRVMHHDQPYYLDYIANQKNFQKYLPQFEQMLKTFKFAK